MLIDQFGRHINYLRVSLTDRCNFRCTYCMPEDMQFAPRSENLAVDELLLIAEAFVALGVEKIRLTGGEPLLHEDFEALLAGLDGLHGLKNIAVTTNGSLLKDKIHWLAKSKVKQLNISLDSLSPEVFSDITRTGKLQPVLEGIDAAIDAGIERIRLNTVVSKGVNDEGLEALLQFAVEKNIHIAFIEEMPLGDMHGYSRSEHYLSNDQLRQRLAKEVELIPQVQKLAQSGPAKYYQVSGTNTEVGFISPHSNNFCSSCNRVRLTREGKLILCLGQEESLDLKQVIRSSSEPIQDLQQAIMVAMSRKPKSHDFNVDKDEVQVVRLMNVTGG